MIDGGRCYAAMSPLEQRRWQKAVNKEPISANFLFNQKFWTFQEFIVYSFTWCETKEGYDYWDWVSNRYILHDLLTPQPRWFKKQPEVWP